MLAMKTRLHGSPLWSGELAWQNASPCSSPSALLPSPGAESMPFARSRSPLSVQVAGVLLCFSAWAQAQTTGEPQTLETVVVTGVRASLGKAVDAKRGAESVTESVVAEDLAAFPDQNIGMALQRLTGVSTTRGSGGKSEGGGVRVRGLSTAFTQSTINGVTLVSPEQGREA